MKKIKKLSLVTSSIFLVFLSFALFCPKSNVRAYSSPVISDVDIVGYSDDISYSDFKTTTPRKDFYDVFYDSSNSEKANIYIKVIQQFKI